MSLPAYQALDEFDYHPRLAATRGTALVLFSSPDCGACRQVERRLPDAVGPEVALFHVDVQRSPALARAFDLFHLPALFLYRDGHYHARLDSQVTPVALAAAIAQALAAPAEEEP
ncbi:MAG: thioredoxin family protein [Pseudomonadota bacterium]